MWSDVLRIGFGISLLAGMFRIATPILFVALGELVSERAGVRNLGVEGTMLTGAFLGFLVASKGDSLWLGVAAAALAGAFMGALMAVLAASLKVDQTVAGLAFNLFASGITFFWYRVAFQGAQLQNIPTVSIFKSVELPLLSRIPFLGQIIFSQGMLTYLVLLSVPVISFFLYRTKYGLQLRCLGENPRVLDMRGVNVVRMQYLALIFGGMMAGIGGCFITLGAVGLFLPDITAGRGWLAIVLVIAGNWFPWRITLMALVFGFVEAFQLQVQGIGIKIPYQILLALPYIVAVLLLIGSRTWAAAPLSLGVPYRRE